MLSNKIGKIRMKYKYGNESQQFSKVLGYIKRNTSYSKYVSLIIIQFQGELRCKELFPHSQTLSKIKPRVFLAVSRVYVYGNN